MLELQALNMTAFNAAGPLDELAGHCDHGSNYLSVVYTDRIVELGAKPSTGTVGDSFDNALAEAVNALYKTELIGGQGPWRTACKSSSRLSNTCGGGTTTVSAKDSATVRPSRSRPRTTVLH